jgi:Uma2 family endonuclease
MEVKMATRRPSIREPDPITANGSHEAGEDVLTMYVPEALYWEHYYEYPDLNFEWNNGQLEVVPVADYAKYIMYLWFLDILRDFLQVQPIARIVGLEVGFRLALPTKTTIRKPDLGLVLNSNPVPLGDHDRSYRGSFDLCIESLSDGSQTDIDRDTIIKRAEYAAAGVQEYYILDERGIETQFYRLTPGGLYQPMPRTNGVIRSVALPGFQFRIQDLYTKPAPPQIVDDPVYSAFVSPLYRAERLRADQERQRADQERLRADQERQRAEEYAALLKAAGLLPPG